MELNNFKESKIVNAIGNMAVIWLYAKAFIKIKRIFRWHYALPIIGFIYFYSDRHKLKADCENFVYLYGMFIYVCLMQFFVAGAFILNIYFWIAFIRYYILDIKY